MGKIFSEFTIFPLLKLQDEHGDVLKQIDRQFKKSFSLIGKIGAGPSCRTDLYAVKFDNHCLMIVDHCGEGYRERKFYEFPNIPMGICSADLFSSRSVFHIRDDGEDGSAVIETDSDMYRKILSFFQSEIAEEMPSHLGRGLTSSEHELIRENVDDLFRDERRYFTVFGRNDDGPSSLTARDIEEKKEQLLVMIFRYIAVGFRN